MCSDLFQHRDDARATHREGGEVGRGGGDAESYVVTEDLRVYEVTRMHETKRDRVSPDEC
jgi:hypothetical protein